MCHFKFSFFHFCPHKNLKHKNSFISLLWVLFLGHSKLKTKQWLLYIIEWNKNPVPISVLCEVANIKWIGITWILGFVCSSRVHRSNNLSGVDWIIKCILAPVTACTSEWHAQPSSARQYFTAGNIWNQGSWYKILSQSHNTINRSMIVVI